ncbi:MAG: hypothetical protein Q8N10_03200 [Phenylobacterium sp.]|uniref:hypothetical protein n=1 Tax=Phenylobacterium sp. TaxID=1871053 RepID=UPI00271900FF|nr:hypothetical protein [Phenylobacterium sp.]MDO8912277.1 hypothetical protein [Phenylobacterium sp.]MDP3099489.1 hypothetical protein [Phenylobacterium sp.]
MPAYPASTPAPITYPAPRPALNCEARAEAERRRLEALIPTRSTATCNATGYGQATCTSETRPNVHAQNAYNLELNRCQLGQ